MWNIKSKWINGELRIIFQKSYCFVPVRHRLIKSIFFDFLAYSNLRPYCVSLEMTFYAVKWPPESEQSEEKIKINK